MAVTDQITDLLVDVELGDRSARATLDYKLHNSTTLNNAQKSNRPRVGLPVRPKTPWPPPQFSNMFPVPATAPAASTCIIRPRDIARKCEVHVPSFSWINCSHDQAFHIAEEGKAQRPRVIANGSPLGNATALGN